MVKEQNKSYKGGENMETKNKLCARCGVNPRRSDKSYCNKCNSELTTHYTKQKAERKAKWLVNRSRIEGYSADIFTAAKDITDTPNHDTQMYLLQNIERRLHALVGVANTHIDVAYKMGKAAENGQL